MKKQLSRAFALLLALCMVCSLLPVTAFAARTAAVQPTATECTLTFEVDPAGSGKYQYSYFSNKYVQGTISEKITMTVPVDAEVTAYDPLPTSEDYKFVEWQLDGEPQENGRFGCSFRAPEGEHTFKAVFEKTSTDYDLTLEVSPEDGGTLTATECSGTFQVYDVGKHQITPGMEISLKAEPAPGYVFEKYLLNDQDPGSEFSKMPWGETEYTYKVNQDSKITAVFKSTAEPEKDHVTFTVTPKSAGTYTYSYEGISDATVSDETQVDIPNGTEVTLKDAQPSENYTFVEWRVKNKNGTTTLPANMAGAKKFTVDGETTVEGVFEITPAEQNSVVTLKIEPAGGGTYQYSFTEDSYTYGKVEQETQVTMPLDTFFTIYIPQPNEGYKFVELQFDGVRQTAGFGNYTLHATESTHTVTAVFEKTSTDCKVTKEISPNDNAGSLKITYLSNYLQEIPETVPAGTEVSLEAKANSGYTFDKFLVNGKENQVKMDMWAGSTMGTYTINEDVTITAVFHKDGETYTISLSAKPEEGGKVSGDGEYAEGDSITIKAEANDGYTFVNWTNGEDEFSNQAEYTFDAKQDLTLVANFKKNDATTPMLTFDIRPEGAGTYDYFYYDDMYHPHTVVVDKKTELQELPADRITLENPEPTKGFEFVAWEVNGEQRENGYYGCDVDLTDTPMTITAIFQPTTQAEQFTVTVVADPEEGGTVTGGGTFDKGTSVTVTAEAKPGYKFDYWTIEGEEGIIHYPLKYTFELQKDTKLTAHFSALEAQTFHVSLSVDPVDIIYGTAFFKDTEDTEGDFAAGTRVTVVATPIHEGATFVGWREKDSTDYLSHELEYSFDVEENIELVACFTDTTKYYLTFAVTPEDGGYLARTPETVKDDSGNEGYPYYANQEVLISGIAWAGYRFDYFLLDGERVPDEQVKLDATGNPTFTLTVTKNHHVEAVFTPLPTYTLTLVGQPTGHCTAIVQVGSAMERYPAGTWVNIKANVDEGYTFLGWYDAYGNPFMVPNSSGELVHLKTIAGVFQITKDTVLVAVAVKDGQDRFTVEATPSSEKGGSVSVTPAGTFKDGDEATVKATPNAGYRFLGWSEGGAIVSTDETYTFTVHTDRTLVALFKLENPRTLTIGVSANPAAGGFVTGGGEYEEETMATVVAQANAGYYFVRWEENGKPVSEDARYTFLVTEDRDLVAVFAKEATREYTVTLELAGGTAPYELTYQVVDGASFTFPAAPTLDGFVFQGWKAENDPKLYLPGESVTVTTDVTFTAQWAAFRPDMHRVILPEDGSVTATPAAATEGAEILLRVQPKENYAVQAVLVRDAFGDAVAVTTRPDGTYSFLMPNSDATVTVVYRYGCDGGADCPSIGFTDFDASRWYHEGIDFAVRHGLINGMEHNTVQPDTTLTRAMLVTMLYRYTAPEGTFENPFVDVPSGAWYTQAVAWAAENGIVKGVGDNKFEPDRSITREELVTVLYRYAQMLGRNVGAAAELSAYPDGSHVSPYAEAAMRWAVAEGIVNGKAVPGSTQIVLQPLGSATRAEVATMLMRFFGNE